MSIVIRILSRLLYMTTWLRCTFFELKLDLIRVPVSSVRLGLSRPWFSTALSDEFERSLLARKELYKSLARLSVAR